MREPRRDGWDAAARKDSAAPVCVARIPNKPSDRVRRSPVRPGEAPVPPADGARSARDQCQSRRSMNHARQRLPARHSGVETTVTPQRMGEQRIPGCSALSRGVCSVTRTSACHLRAIKSAPAPHASCSREPVQALQASACATIRGTPGVRTKWCRQYPVVRPGAATGPPQPIATRSAATAIGDMPPGMNQIVRRQRLLYRAIAVSEGIAGGKALAIPDRHRDQWRAAPRPHWRQCGR